MRKLLPILLMLIGLGAGVGAGVALKPATPMLSEHPCGPDPNATAKETAKDEVAETGEDPDKKPDSQLTSVKFNNQFVVPVIEEEVVASLVVISLSVELSEPGQEELVFSYEPKLRDAYLQVMFDHANLGGFSGKFTEMDRMGPLRQALLEVSRDIMGGLITGVHIEDIARQDV